MKRILIVEDDLTIAELERDYLEMYGYEVEICANGEDGLKAALREDWNLVLLDLMLPGVNGFQILKRIREEKETPVLLVTARKEDIDKAQGLGAGADDYIVKPFSPGEMVMRVNAHIARYERLTSHGERARGEGGILIGEMRIDPKARRVFIAEKEIALVNKEFELLHFLASNPNIVFSKDTLFDRVWGLDSLGDASTVTVHINRIREKIEKDSGTPEYIETVWGAGYRMRA